jgi:hypothetical protein
LRANLHIAIPAIGAAVFLAVVETVIDLGVQGSFGKRLYGETEATGYFRRAA